MQAFASAASGGDRGRAVLEALEQRRLLSVSIDADEAIRTVDERLLGTNLAWWQAELTTPRMEEMVRASGMKLFRLPGGSSSNSNRHFDTTNPGDWYNSPPEIANFIERVGGDGMVCVNYGTGSPQEAAAYLAYYNAEVGDDTVIGVGMQWDQTLGKWVAKDWKTAGYWASIRAASPLAVDDGLNHLRAGHADPWRFTYYEVGNENYATWEQDEHGRPGDAGAPQDPATYVSFASTFAQLASQIDPNAKIGLSVALPLQWNMPDEEWTAHVLQESAARGFTPGFLSDHLYVDNLSDRDLLINSTNDPDFTGWRGYPAHWAGRAEYYRTRINRHLGTTAGANVEIMLTEFNSDLDSKQSVNLVNGLWLADSIGGLIQTEYKASLFWDLTNGFQPLNPSGEYYGWRNGMDNGMISTGPANGPTSGAFVPYPTYFAEQILSHFVENGATVVEADSTNEFLSVYAVRQFDGDLALLVINKASVETQTETFTLDGFTANGTARAWRYGKVEDSAQSLTADGRASISTFADAISGSSFTRTFPAYSMTVIELDGGQAPPRGTVVGTGGNDVIRVIGSGDDFEVTVNNIHQLVPPNLGELFIDAGGGNDVIIVDPGITLRMLITGSGGNDTIVGGSGDDELSGASGKDRVLGGGGEDYLLGGKHNDYLNGEDGDDQLSGGGGKDRLFAGAGHNYLRGGAHDDVFFSGNDSQDTVSGHAGFDTLVDPDDEDLGLIASIERVLRT